MDEEEEEEEEDDAPTISLQSIHLNQHTANAITYA